MKSRAQPMGRQQQAQNAQESSLIDDVMRGTRPAIALMFVFSLFSNLLRLTTPLFMIQVMDRVLSSRNQDTLINLFIIAVVAITTSALIVAATRVMQNRVGSWVERALLEPILRAGLEGKLADRSMGGQTVRDLGQVRSFFAQQTLTSLFDIPWMPAFLLIIFIISPVAGIVGLVFALVMFGLAALNILVTRRAQMRGQEDQSQNTQQIIRAFQNSDLMHSMGMVANFLRGTVVKSEAARRAADIPAERSATISSLSRGIRQIAQITILAVGAYLVTQGQSTSGVMMASSSLFGLAMSPLDGANQTWRGLSQFREALARLRRQLSVTDEDAEFGRAPLFRPTGQLSVQQAMYFPQGRKRPVLKPISFEVAPGEMVGILGPASAGKTVLAKMLVGLLPPLSGSVQLDGVNLHEWLNAGVGRHLGYLQQDPTFLPGSLADNIGRLEPHSPERSTNLRAAIELVQAQSTLLNLPQGLDTDVEAAATQLSRSEMQKVALARAFYGNPQLIVLDEPSTFLDKGGEAALVSALGACKERGATIIVVSQRPAIMRLCERLIVLRDGVMDAYGASSEVLEQVRNSGDEPGPDRRLRLASS